MEVCVNMSKIKRILATFFILVFTVSQFNISALAYSDTPDFFDFQDTVMSINAGESKTMWMRTNYNYTYYLGPHTSKFTYLECSFTSGSQNVTFHIGADEQEKNVMFYFYVDDERVQNTDVHDNVEVYVQSIQKPTN